MADSSRVERGAPPRRLTEELPLSTGPDTSSAPSTEQVKLFNPSQVSVVYARIGDDNLRIAPLEAVGIKKQELNGAIREQIARGDLRLQS